MSETPGEMLAQVLALVERDTNVQAVGVEGSLNDPGKKGDAWQDLDVTLFVTDTASKYAAPYLALFGTPTIVRHFHEKDLWGQGGVYWETFLTRYPGSQRMDLKLAPAAVIDDYLAAESLNAIVWRRGIGPVPPRPTDASSFYLAAPTQAEFADHCAELLWIAGNVVKGLARHNLIYAAGQFNDYLRPELFRLLSWQVTLERSGQFDPGVSHKGLWAALPTAVRDRVMATYDLHNTLAITAALRQTLALYTETTTAITRLGGLPPLIELAPALAQIHQWLDQPLTD